MPVWLDPLARRTSRAGVTTQIRVAFGQDVGGVEALQAVDDLVAFALRVPGLRIAASVSMREDRDGEERVVVLEDVGQVGVGFTAFVARGVQRSGCIIDSICEGLPSAL